MPEKSYNLYKRERRADRRRWPYMVGTAVAVVAALLAWQVIGVPRVSAVTPGPEQYVKNGALTVVLDVRGLPRLSDVRVTFDGKDVTDKASLSGNRLRFTPGTLSDGAHSVTFDATSSNLFRHHVRKDWRFVVDTSLPTLALDGAADEARINTSPATFSGTTEPFATVTVTSGAVVAKGQADAGGNYSVSAKLPDGPSSVAVSTADRAGNTTSKHLQVFVDAQPPTLEVTQLGETLGTAHPKIHIKALDQLGEPKVKVVIDGQERTLKGPVGDTVFRPRSLAQGKHSLSITASDQGGSVVTDKQTFVVDSTEKFGAAVMWPGATGKDVKKLQKRLIGLGVYSGPKTGVYDHRTEVAVKKFQSKYGLVADGRVGGRVLNALSGQIVIDLGSLRLYLYRGGHLVKTYGIAAGQPAYPTPTGSYAIVTMQKDPTWLPPDSDWAKDAQPIPPGADNPLGTRWMGTSAPGVGIHGVPPSSDYSIGSYASHGCIRMHNWDAVELFDRIAIGMPVLIRQ